MIKVFEDLYDNFTDKEYNFTAYKSNANEIFDMINRSTTHHRMFNKSKVITNNITFYTSIEDNNIMYNISVNLKRSEWTKLLSLCTTHKYQLIIKDDKNIMCFIKKETK